MSQKCKNHRNPEKIEGYTQKLWKNADEMLMGINIVKAFVMKIVMSQKSLKRKTLMYSAKIS